VACLGALSVPQIVCLAGDEARRIEYADPDAIARVAAFVISPRSGTDALVERGLHDRTFELPAAAEERRGEDGFVLHDAPLGLALQAADLLAPGRVMLAGYDGYDAADEGYRHIEAETQEILSAYAASHPDRPLRSLTATKYDCEEVSVHALVQDR